MDNFKDVFDSLRMEAKSLGYKVFPTTTRNEIDPKYKIIRMKFYVKDEENLFSFCHELGHAKEKKHNLNLYRDYKVYRILSEIKAWVLGFAFVNKYKLNRSKYITSAIGHLRTYIAN